MTALGRRIEFDERSRNFPIRALTVGARPRSYTWRIQHPFVTDQGQEGACVGFAVANELFARPSEVAADYPTAQALASDLYCEAQTIDPWDGGSRACGHSPHYEGTSVLAGMKAAQRRGYFEEYRWAFGLIDLVLGLGRNGPAVIGVNWYSGMFSPDSNGFVTVSGSVSGGHAVLVRGIKVVWDGRDLDLEKSYVTFRNSWGPNWGKGGDGRMTLSTLGRLLDESGEAVFALRRKTSV